jgi:hypothetical protein
VSDWIEHDGADPQYLPRIAGMKYRVRFDRRDAYLDHGPSLLPASAPQWFWRWKRVRVGLFRTELRRVCDEPTCAPILAYRIEKPRALQELIEIVESLPEPAKPLVPA